MAFVGRLAHLQELDDEGETHGQIYVGFIDMFAETLDSERDADADQKREREHLKRGTSLNEDADPTREEQYDHE